MSKFKGKKCEFCEGTGEIVHPEHQVRKWDGDIVMEDEQIVKCKICNGTGREVLFTFQEIGDAWLELAESGKPLTVDNFIATLRKITEL